MGNRIYIYGMSKEQNQTPPAAGSAAITIPVRTRTRSPAYPSIPLREALQQAEKIWTAQHKHAAHVDAVVTTMGFNKQTGDSLRAVSALSQYGLTKETGGGDSRNIALSDLALD